MKRIFATLLALLLLLSGCARQPEPEIQPTAAEPGSFAVHYIDVGQADCALLECGGEYLLIDGGNREDSSLVVTYLQEQGVEELAAVICTHAHEDHVGGLPGVLAVYPTAAVYAPTNTYSSNIFDKFVYYTDQQGLEITIPQPGDTLTLGDAVGTFLGPVKSYPDTNNTSLMMNWTYGEIAFLFTGDMEKEAESDLVDYWGDDAALLHADVLKVGHHGSDTSSGYRFLNAVAPEYGVISVGAGNSYGHPHKEPLERLAQAEVTLLRTDLLGHILAVSDGKNVTFTWQDPGAEPTQVTQGAMTYIGNRNSHKLHAPDCGSLPKEENRVYFDTYQEAIDAGYSPCGSCLG